MNITPVTIPLKTVGLGEPKLNALIPDVKDYSTLLFQPHGEIEVNSSGIRNQNRELAVKQFSGFLKEACEAKVDLAVTPEYSMPWEVLVESIRAGEVPGEGVLWAMGCESIKYSELEKMKTDFAAHAVVLFENLEADDDRFVDPLAYVFIAPALDDSVNSQLVILVQFKTCAMGKIPIELDCMQNGSEVYHFGDGVNYLRLITLICSDAFDFDTVLAKEYYKHTLVLHIQLNPSPRHTVFRRYRDRLFEYGSEDTQLLCLNWAKDVQHFDGKTTEDWNNICGSAWYLGLKNVIDDVVLVDNHKKGLYYTWCESMMVHALFFNYQPGLYFFKVSKVAHIGVTRPLSIRRGPRVTSLRVWDDTTSAWIGRLGHQDGFDSVLPKCGEAKESIKKLASKNPFHAERVLALCAGRVGTKTDWYHLRNLDSCGVEVSEMIQRMTFCQDTDPSGIDFRNQRLGICAKLWKILKDEDLPRAIADLKSSPEFDWAPHQNIVSEGGSRATVVYMGELVSESEVAIVEKKLADLLRREALDSGDDAVLNVRQRLHLWYRDLDDTIQLFDPTRYTTFDESHTESVVDIARET